MTNNPQTTVRLRPGIPKTTIKGVNYVAPWAISIGKPDGTAYYLTVLNRGKYDTRDGLDVSQYWRSDPDTLFQFIRSGKIDGVWSQGPIPPGDANDISEIFAQIGRGEQRMTDEISGGGLENSSFHNEVTSFLAPRIGIAIENLDEDGTVRVGYVEDILESREGRDNPPLPRS